MSTAMDGTPISRDIPFLDIVDQEFRFDAPEVIEAQARCWYANSPLGILVLRFTPANDRRVAAFIRAKAQELTDRLAMAGTCEFVEDFGNPLPLAVMCELLGVPAEDYDTFRVWTTDIGLVFSLAHGGDIPRRVENALTGLNAYVDAIMADKAAAPADDLISALVLAQREDQARVSMEELRNLIVTMVFAAHDTTRHQLGNAMVAFAAHPEQWRLLGSRPELAPQATDEVIRWIPSTGTVYRFATEDIVFRDVPFAKGTFFMVCVDIAQRDPRVFRNGATFDITVARDAPALQFGGGPHHCLGAALAKTEIAEVLPVLTGRLAPPVVAGPVGWRPPVGIHGPEPLPLRFGTG